MLVRRFVTCAAALSLAACAGDGDGLDENGRPVDGGGGAAPLTADLASIQSNVFTPVCTTCHSGAAAPLGLRLDEGASFAMLVNTPSVEVPALNRVTPGDPDASYLIQKLEGTANVGGRMPLNGPPLSADTIAVIRQWITDGAAASATMISATKPDSPPPQLMAVSPMQAAVLTEAPREILLSANTALDTTLLSAGTVSLQASGGDGDFANGNEQAIDTRVTVRSLEPTVIVVGMPAATRLPADEYELRVSGGLDLASRAIDGDGDGEPGGDFVLRFQLESVR